MKALSLVVVCGSLLAGCVAVPPMEARVVSFPAVGSEAVVGVGEPMLRQGYGFMVERVTITDSAVLKGEELKGQYRVESVDGSLLTLVGDMFFILLDESSSTACFLTAIPIAAKGCQSGIEVKFTKSKDLQYVQSNYLQQTLLYSGRIGNRIRFSYREFSDGLARSSFTNDAEYDLSESRQIGYRGALIEVLDANNMKIRYRVLRNF